jgi:polar amino acid transport system substrate-binding protein
MTRHWLCLALVLLVVAAGPIAVQARPLPPDTAQVRVGVHPFPPFVIETEDDEFTGLCVDLWEDIAAEMGVNYEYVRYTDPIGMVRALDYREIDIAINPLYVSSVRLDMFEVSQPFFISSVGVATTSIARSQFQVLLQNFFSVDFLKIVLLLFGVLLVFGTLLWFVERGENRYQFRPGLRGLLDGLWWAAVTMTTVGYGDKAPKTQAGRTIAIVWMFSAVIIVSGFTATIASTLTVNSLAAEIKQLEDLRSVERIGTVNATSSADFLVSHDLLPTHEYETPRAALQALARQEIDVIVYDRTVMRYLINREKLDGSVELLPVTFNQQYRSFLMPRGSTLRRRLDPLLVRRINQADWQAVLRKYNLETAN